MIFLKAFSEALEVSDLEEDPIRMLPDVEMI
jgi:hypothetical protein